MRQFCIVILAAMSVIAVVPAGAKEHTYYLELINRAHDSVTAVAIAPAGEEDFLPMTLAGPLRGGGGSATLQIAGAQCLYDVRVQFRDGRTGVQRNVDVCRHRGLRLRALPRASGDAQVGAKPVLAQSED